MGIGLRTVSRVGHVSPPVGDVLEMNLGASAVEEETLEELDAEDAKDDEEGAADEDDVSDGFEAGEQSPHHQLQTRSPAQVGCSALHCILHCTSLYYTVLYSTAV